MIDAPHQRGGRRRLTVPSTGQRSNREEGPPGEATASGKEPNESTLNVMYLQHDRSSKELPQVERAETGLHIQLFYLMDVCIIDG